MHICHCFFNRNEMMIPIPRAAIMPPKVLSRVVSQPGIMDAKSACADAAVMVVRRMTAGIKRHARPINCPHTTLGIYIFPVSPASAYLLARRFKGRFRA